MHHDPAANQDLHRIRMGLFASNEIVAEPVVCVEVLTGSPLLVTVIWLSTGCVCCSGRSGADLTDFLNAGSYNKASLRLNSEAPVALLLVRDLHAPVTLKLS